jgi:hypothetical protein
MYKISLCLAGIRPHFWVNFYQSAVAACTRYDWELVIISPFEMPEELKQHNNIKFIKEFGNPVRATQRGLSICEGQLVTFPADDGVFLKDSLDSAIDLWNAQCSEKDGIVMRYREGAGGNVSSFPLEYWNAGYHIDTNHLNLGHDYKVAPQPMVDTKNLIEMGGFDCSVFECMSWATHDQNYRLQRNGGIFHLSPLEVQSCDNYGATGVDHAPIYHAHFVDQAAFNSIYTNPEVKNRIKIDFDAWKNVPERWERRWG